eukprot:TRINITY_DN5774_c0_g1_i1.p1 TRINITY_DN5774_c0_g1~~TRINITY_DN5774_c0_g1_i1.p1  ORF type:complete len:633 (+),score=126.91 TRINITY_DN5774_c0_g1_i1:628-2526(+)
MCYLSIELYRKAYIDAKKALELDDNFDRAYLIKGLAQWYAGKKEKATKTWREGLEHVFDVSVYTSLKSCLCGELKGISWVSTYTSCYNNVIPTLRQTSEVQSLSQPQSQTRPQLESPPQSQSQSPSQPHSQPQSKSQTQALQKSQQQSQQQPQEQAHLQQVQQLKLRPQSCSQQPKVIVDDLMVRQLETSIGPEVIKGFILEQVVPEQYGMQIRDGTGDGRVDKYIALGYLLVNRGDVIRSRIIFNNLLHIFPTLVAAYLGRGTANALSGQLNEAMVDLTKAIEINPTCVEAYKRLAQVLLGLGMAKEALESYAVALDIRPEADSHQERGSIYYKLKNYKLALKEFEAKLRFSKKDPLTYYHLGLCYFALGNFQEAYDSYEKALSLKLGYRETLLRKGQLLEEWGTFNPAMETYQQLLKLYPECGEAYSQRGWMCYVAGRPYDANLDYERAISIFQEPDIDLCVKNGLAKHALGLFREADKWYKQALTRDPLNNCWYLHEMMLWWQRNLDQPFEDLNPCRDINPIFQEILNQKSVTSSLGPSKERKINYKTISNLDQSIEDVVYARMLGSEIFSKLLNFSRPYGQLLHQRVPGFMPNARQQKMGGLAALHATQDLREYWCSWWRLLGEWTRI